MTQHLAGGLESFYMYFGLKNVTVILRFCYLKIPCLRINIT